MTPLESARDALVEGALEWAVAEVPSLVRDRLAQRLCDRADAYRLALAANPAKPEERSTALATRQRIDGAPEDVPRVHEAVKGAHVTSPRFLLCGCMFSGLEPHRQQGWCPEHLKAMAPPTPGNARHIHLFAGGPCSCGQEAPEIRYVDRGASFDETLPASKWRCRICGEGGEMSTLARELHLNGRCALSRGDQ